MNIYQEISENAQEINRLNGEIHRTLPSRDQGPEQHSAWAAACQNFHSSYDALAFPGGLGVGLDKLRSGIPEAIETAVIFLEADPWFYRSGYIKAEIIQRIIHFTLSDEQSLRLQRVVLQIVKGRERREFRWIARLASVVRTPSFVSELQSLHSSPHESVRRHSRWILEYLARFPPHST